MYSPVVSTSIYNIYKFSCPKEDSSCFLVNASCYCSHH